MLNKLARWCNNTGIEWKIVSVCMGKPFHFFCDNLFWIRSINSVSKYVFKQCHLNDILNCWCFISSELINVILFEFLNCVKVFQVKTLITFYFFWNLKDIECKADKKLKLWKSELYACLYKYILKWTRS